MNKVISFCIGASAGALAALMLAPKNGEETRALVTEKANAVVGEVKDFGAGMPGAAQEAFSAVQSKGQEFVADASAKVKGVAGQVGASAPAEPDDDLRRKIEEARQRIAAQVMENAEANKAVEVSAEAQQAAE